MRSKGVVIIGLLALVIGGGFLNVWAEGDADAYRKVAQETMDARKAGLNDLATLVGPWNGKGTSILGPFADEMVVEPVLGGTCLQVTTKSYQNKQQVSEDVNFIVFDVEKKQLVLLSLDSLSFGVADLKVEAGLKSITATPMADMPGDLEWSMTLTSSGEGAYKASFVGVKTEGAKPEELGTAEYKKGAGNQEHDPGEPDKAVMDAYNKEATDAIAARKAGIEPYKAYVGKWAGTGSGVLGAFQDAVTIEEILDGTVLKVHTVTSQGEEQVDEDLSFITYDVTRKQVVVLSVDTTSYGLTDLKSEDGLKSVVGTPVAGLGQMDWKMELKSIDADTFEAAFIGAKEAGGKPEELFRAKYARQK